jgi:ribonuclease J
MLDKNNEFIFLPLGGSNEIGMNLNLYGYGPDSDRKWIIVDVGVTFGDVTTPGVDVICPDPSFLEGENILAIVLTHAHEDHIGAIGWLWDWVKAPVYSTAFTHCLIIDKLREHNVLDDMEHHLVAPGDVISIGPFLVEYINITHSIPEANGVLIKTDLGSVMHTGDWKLDHNPIATAPTQISRIKEIGKAGVLAMVCDSTNVFVDGEAGSESDVLIALKETILIQKQKVAVACFASNVARVDTVMRIAQEAGRHVCLVGRSMHRITAAARQVGLLADLPMPISESEASKLDDNRVLYICTGSQGEPRAALSRIADDHHPLVSFGEGDVCIFSSRVIPGNEIPIRSLQNRLSDKGVEIITEKDRPGIHVSGHPCRDELIQMMDWVKPEIVIPTHGERRHIIKHAQLAQSVGIRQTITPKNGDMVKLAPNQATIIDEVPSGRLYVDGGILVPQGAEALRERRHAAHNGMIFISFALNSKSRLASIVDVRALGMAFETDEQISDQLERIGNQIEDMIRALGQDQKEDDASLEPLVIRLVKKMAKSIWDRKPLVEVIILRL